MADTPAKPKPKIETSKWARERPKLNSAVEKRRALWSAVNAFVVKHGGWITSPADTATIRIEAPTSSPLPSLLADLGYSVQHVGQATRLTNKTGAASPWVVMDVVSITLPG